MNRLKHSAELPEKRFLGEKPRDESQIKEVIRFETRFVQMTKDKGQFAQRLTSWV